MFSRLRGASATGRAIRTERLPNGTPVGYRAALSALLAAVAAAVVGAMLIKYPVDDKGDAIATNGALVAEWSQSALDEVQQNPDATAEGVVDAVDDWMPNGEKPTWWRTGRSRSASCCP